MEFTVPLDSPFSLEYTVESGQLFRWERKGDWWSGVVGGSAIKVKQEGDLLRCSPSSDRVDGVFIREYFRLGEDLDHILTTISKDRVISGAVQRFYGLRLVKQDPWECLASFVLATNANIPRIKRMVAAISEEYGTAFEFDGETYRGFPSAEALAGSPVRVLRRCGLGYRAPFLKRIAKSVAEGKVDFGEIRSMDYESAHLELLKEVIGEKVLPGVGPKVADCVLLYSCGKDEAFPIDVWIAKVLARSYPKLLGPTIRPRLAHGGKLSQVGYEAMSKAARKHFGRYAGYAQQYLYMAAREMGI